MSESSFLSRWSRRKAAVREGVAVPAEPAQAEPGSEAVPTTVETTQEAPQSPPPTLADVAALRPGDEIARFVARGVDESVKRAALKTLFADPHFNVMDGLDIYIDDYTKPDPIPPEILRQLRQAQTLGLFEPTDEERAAAEAAARLSGPEQVPPATHEAANDVADEAAEEATDEAMEQAAGPLAQVAAPASAETSPAVASQSEEQGQQDPHKRA